MPLGAVRKAFRIARRARKGRPLLGSGKKKKKPTLGEVGKKARRARRNPLRR